MLGIDTNILVRFLVRDDEVQFEKARKLIHREIAAGRRVFVNQLVLMEAEWVLYNCAILNRHYGQQNCATKGIINSGLFCMVSKV